MKKSIKHKSQPARRAAKIDIADIINKMQETLVGLERKIDVFISQSSQKVSEVKLPVRPNQPAQHTHQQPERKPENNQRERILHKAICADCNKECEVPFKPSGDRPVYCKECFGLRKTWNPAKPKQANPPAAPAPMRVDVVEKSPVLETKKPAGKKKPEAKKRKSSK